MRLGRPTWEPTLLEKIISHKVGSRKRRNKGNKPLKPRVTNSNNSQSECYADVTFCYPCYPDTPDSDAQPLVSNKQEQRTCPISNRPPHPGLCNYGTASNQPECKGCNLCCAGEAFVVDGEKFG